MPCYPGPAPAATVTAGAYGITTFVGVASGGTAGNLDCGSGVIAGITIDRDATNGTL